MPIFVGSSHLAFLTEPIHFG